jgi:hypothetical protein
VNGRRNKTKPHLVASTADNGQAIACLTTNALFMVMFLKLESIVAAFNCGGQLAAQPS